LSLGAEECGADITVANTAAPRSAANIFIQQCNWTTDVLQSKSSKKEIAEYNLLHRR